MIFLRRKEIIILKEDIPTFGNLVPRDVASRAAKERCDAGYGVGETGLAVNLDFRDAIKKQGKKAIENKYGNLFEMYKTSPELIHMKNRCVSILPAIIQWVDYGSIMNL